MQNVRNWESGKAGLTPAKAREIAALLGCDWRELYGDPDWLGPRRSPARARPVNGPMPLEIPDNHRLWQHLGDTLTARGILSGDLILVQSSGIPREGEVALATVAEVGSTHQRDFFAVRAGRFLVEHPISGQASSPIPLEGPGIAIRGIARQILRQTI